MSEGSGRDTHIAAYLHDEEWALEVSVEEVLLMERALRQIVEIDLVKYVGAPLLEVQRIARDALRKLDEGDGRA